MRLNIYLLCFCVIALFGAIAASGTNGDIPDEGNGDIPDEGNGDIPDEGNGDTPDEGNGDTPDEGNGDIPDEGNGDNSTSTAPTTPSTAAPTTPSTAAPTTPSTAAPTSPSTAAPTSPSTAAPTSPSTAAPTSPSTAAPTSPSTAAPTTPSTAAPTTPSTAATTTPSTAATTTPSTAATTTPSTAATTTPSTAATTTPSTAATTTPSTAATTTPSTAATTTPSTAATTTPSTAAPTTPSITTSSPIEDKFDYVVKDETGNLCLALQMTITLNIQYTTKAGSSASKQLKVPDDAVIYGACKPLGADMIFIWREKLTLAEEAENRVAAEFMQNDGRLSLNRIGAKIYLDEKNFPDAKEKTLIVLSDTGLGLFSVSTSNNVHRCDIETVVSSKNVNFVLSNVLLLPVNQDTNLSKASEDNCVAEAGANVGAIVGGIIGGLAIVSIIGIIVWRRRRQANTYKQNV